MNYLEKITQVEFDECVKLHLAWLNKEPGGDKLAMDDMDFSGINFRSANLREAWITGSTFTGAKLDGVNFSFSRLTNNNFDDCDLSHCDFTRANIKGSSFIDITVTTRDFQSFWQDLETDYISMDPNLQKDYDTIKVFTQIVR